MRAFADANLRLLNGFSGQHSLVIMPTGMGKSLCYQIPAILLAENNRARHRFRKKTADARHFPVDCLDERSGRRLNQKGVDATFINSSLQRQERDKRYAEVQAGSFDLLYVTPERFRKSDFLDVIAHREIVCWPLTKPIASANGDTTFDPITRAWARFAERWETRPRSPSPRPPRRTCNRTLSASWACSRRSRTVSPRHRPPESEPGRDSSLGR